MTLFGTPTAEVGRTRQLNARQAMGHDDSASDVWLTPPHVIDALGPFDLDPCAAPEPRPWPTATRHLTHLDNGLYCEWDGRVWLNPPYGNIRPWLCRLAEHGNGIALIFARTDTETFHAECWAKATAMLFLKGRLTFHRRNGKPATANSGAPSVLIAYDAANAAVLQQCGLAGAFVDLSARTVGQADRAGCT